jgi:dephospho-CoA kinase
VIDFKKQTIMIIALVGTNGSGKGTFCEISKDYGFETFTMSDEIFEEIKKRGLEPSRDNTRAVANDLRRTFGPEYLARVGFEKAVVRGGNCIIDGVRCIGELNFLIEMGAVAVGVDAPVELRYQRVIQRGTSKDALGFGEFKVQDYKENSGTDPWDMNITSCLEKCEALLTNNGPREELEEKVEEFFIEKEIERTA